MSSNFLRKRTSRFLFCQNDCGRYQPEDRNVPAFAVGFLRPSSVHINNSIQAVNIEFIESSCLLRLISSLFRQSPSAFSTSSSFSLMSVATSFTSTLRLIQPLNGLHSSFFTLFLMTSLLNTLSGIEIVSMTQTFNGN